MPGASFCWPNSASPFKFPPSIRTKTGIPASIRPTWHKAVFEYVQGGVAKTKTFTLSMGAIAPNTWQTWQNSRAYHEVGDVLYLDAPLPSSLTVKLYFSGYSTPVSFTKTLAPYSKTFGMPFRAFDLAPNEVWESASTHGGGGQVFAYDMGVQGLENGVWTWNQPNTTGTENAHSRIWGKPIYAMADGVVKGFNNTVPNNPKPGQQANSQAYTNGGAGNHFYIQHGDNIALYAHMQKSTLNAALLLVGKVVKAGAATLYAGVFKAGAGAYALWHSSNWTDFTTKWAEMNGQGYRLVDVDTDGTGNNTIYSSTFVAGNDGYALWESNWNSFVSYWEHSSAKGLRLVDLNIRTATGPGFSAGGGSEFAGEEAHEDVLLIGPALADRSRQPAGTVDVKVFPNPVTDQLTITAAADIQTWTLHNALGRLVMQGEGQAYVQDAMIRVEDLPIGMYQLTVRTALGSTTRQVEVLR